MNENEQDLIKHGVPVYKECVSYGGYACRGMTEEEHNIQKLYYKNIKLNEELEKVKRGLDAAKRDIYMGCETCAHSKNNNKTNERCKFMYDCYMRDHWEWRGVRDKE